MGTSESDAARRQRGLERMQEVYRFEVQDGPGDFFGYTVDHLFAEIWSRPGLADRDRRLILLGLLVAQGRFDVVELQLESAIKAGEFDAESLRELVIFLCHYAGWPAGATVNTTVETLIHRHGL